MAAQVDLSQVVLDKLYSGHAPSPQDQIFARFAFIEYLAYKYRDVGCFAHYEGNGIMVAHDSGITAPPELWNTVRACGKQLLLVPLTMTLSSEPWVQDYLVVACRASGKLEVFDSPAFPCLTFVPQLVELFNKEDPQARPWAVVRSSSSLAPHAFETTFRVWSTEENQAMETVVRMLFYAHLRLTNPSVRSKQLMEAVNACAWQGNMTARKMFTRYQSYIVAIAETFHKFGVSQESLPVVAEEGPLRSRRHIAGVPLPAPAWDSRTYEATQESEVVYIRYLQERHKSLACFEEKDVEVFVDKVGTVEVYGKMGWGAIKACTRRFVGIPLTVWCEAGGSEDAHANFLIYDTKRKTLERFEPHGYREDCHDIDEAVRESAESSGVVVAQYFSPLDFCPKAGPQKLSGREEQDVLGEKGRCIVWALLYADWRLSNPEKSRDQVVERALQQIRESPASFTDVGRRFATFVMDLRAREQSGETFEQMATRERGRAAAGHAAASAARRRWQQRDVNH